MWSAVEKLWGSWMRPNVRLVWLWSPVRITDRLAPQEAEVQNALSNRTPPWASRSMFGVDTTGLP